MDEDISRATPSGWLDMTDSPSIERATPSGWGNVEADEGGSIIAQAAAQYINQVIQ